MHSKVCPDVQSLMYDVERKIEVEWARAAEDAFPVRIVIHTTIVPACSTGSPDCSPRCHTASRSPGGAKTRI